MALEPLEINKDNLSKQTFFSLLSNINERFNNILLDDQTDIETTTKILSQVTEAFAFYNMILAYDLNQNSDYTSLQNQLNSINDRLLLIDFEALQNLVKDDITKNNLAQNIDIVIDNIALTDLV